MEKFMQLKSYFSKATLWSGVGQIQTSVAMVSKALSDDQRGLYKIVTFNGFEDFKKDFVLSSGARIKSLIEAGHYDQACGVLQELLNNRATTRIYSCFLKEGEEFPYNGQSCKVIIGPGTDGKNRVKKFIPVNDAAATDIDDLF